MYPSTATSLTFSNVGGQGVAVATGIKLYKAASTTLTATEGAKTGVSGAFTVNPGAASAMVFVNCTKPNGNTTCAGAPLSIGNGGTLQANVALTDAYGNTATAASALSINLTSSSTANYTVAPSPVTIAAGGTQTNQLTVTPAKNNAHVDDDHRPRDLGRLLGHHDPGPEVTSSCRCLTPEVSDTGSARPCRRRPAA